MAWQLKALEKRQDSFDAGLAALRSEISAGFANLRTDIKEQRLVTKDLYDSEQGAQNDRIDSAVKLAMWSLALVCTLVLGSLVTLLARVATA